MDVMDITAQSSLFQAHGTADRAPQNSIDAQQPSQLAIARTPPRSLSLRDASIIDPKDGATHLHCNVQLRAGLIGGLSRHENRTQALAARSDTERTVDLAGAFLLPGLIDCHVYLAASIDEATRQSGTQQREMSLLRQPLVARQMLRRGFTSVRDCGGAGSAIKIAVAKGLYPGPRLLTCERCICPSSPATGEGGSRYHVASGVDACLRAAREVVGAGADFVCIAMSSGGSSGPTTRYTAPEIQAFVEVAEAAGAYVSARVGSDAELQLAVANGVKEIRDVAPWLEANVARVMAEKGVRYTPSVRRHLLAARDGQRFTNAEDRLNRERMAVALIRSVHVPQNAGVQVCYGSSVLPHDEAQQSDDFDLKKASALPTHSVDVLQSATINAARLLGQEGKLGRIKEGFIADLGIWKAGTNPLDDLGVLSRPNESLLAVIKEGRVVESRWSNLPSEDEGLGMIA